MAAYPLVTANDRPYECTACAGAARARGGGLEWSSSAGVTFEGRFLDTDTLQTQLADVLEKLSENIGRYKDWLTAKQNAFETYFSTYDASEELFNRLNLVVGKIKQGLKMLTAWYMHVQEIVSDVSDGIGKYVNAKNALESHGGATAADQAYSIGLPTNALAAAKRNRTAARTLHKQRTKALQADATIRQAMLRLDAELKAFNRGVIRTGGKNGKFVDLKELGAAVDSLYGGSNDSPLVRVQHELADMINTSQITVRLTHGETPKLSATDAFVGSLKVTDSPTTEYEAMNALMEVADRRLYTINERRNIDKTIATAERVVTTAHNKARVAELTKTIRDNTPTAVLATIRRTMREEEHLFLNMARLKRLLKYMHREDRPVYERLFRTVLDETMETARTMFEGRVRAETDSGGGGGGKQHPSSEAHDNDTVEDEHLLMDFHEPTH